MADIIQLADLKLYLNIEAADTQFDSLLAMLIKSVSEAAQREMRRTLLETTYTNFELDGNGKSVLWLPNWPVTALASVKEDGAALTEGDDFELYPDEGYLKRLEGGTWAEGSRNIVVTYTAGYKIADIPPDVKLACMRQIGFEWKQQKSALWGDTSRSFPDGSVSVYAEGELLPSVKEVFRRHSRMRV